MITKSVLENLKQIDVSKDKEKTKARVKETWASLDKENREKILELAGNAKSAVERSYKRGNLTPRLTAAFAACLSINPLYLTGEADAADGYSDELLLSFLKDKGAGKKRARKPVAKQSVKASPRKAKPVLAEAAPKPRRAATAGGFSLTLNSKEYSVSENDFANLKKMSEDETLALVRGLLIRSKYGAEAESIANVIKFLLTV